MRMNAWEKTGGAFTGERCVEYPRIYPLMPRAKSGVDSQKRDFLDRGKGMV